MDERIGAAPARELGEELRNYRESQRLTCGQLGERLGWSASKVSRIENGQIGVSEVDVVRFAAHCGALAESIDELLQMCRDPGVPGFCLSRRLSTLVFHESAAVASASYDPLLVPGLLQTEEYTTALTSTDQPWLVNVKMERQRVVHRRKFDFYIHQQALRLPVGGDRVMNEQLLKLVLLSEQPQIRIRIVPTDLGAAATFGGPFVLFRYLKHQPLVYLEHWFLGFFVDDQDYVSKYQETVSRLSDVALSRGESREMLAALASEFDLPEGTRDAPDHLAEEHLQRS